MSFGNMSYTRSCPVCSSEGRKLFLKGQYEVLECGTCGHVYADVVPDEEHVTTTYSDEYFFGGKAGYPDYLDEARLVHERGRRYAKILSRHTVPGRVLDVGAAAGFLLQGFVESGWEGLGIEPNATMVHYGRERLGLDLRIGTLEELTVKEHFDLVTMIQVVAHFANLRIALHNAARVTRHGGFWLIEGWNRDSIVARVFGRNWHEYSPPSVLHWFSPRSLANLVREFGFREVTRGRLTKRITGAHAKSVLLHNRGSSWIGGLASKAATFIPERATLPYLGDDLFYALYRKDAE
jgi:SAM-dependent methyltransferase